MNPLMAEMLLQVIEQERERDLRKRTGRTKGSPLLLPGWRTRV